ncbi:amidase [Salinisphaera dokdonensis CL-ES53]|uniref:Amidase n=1 Tax=Salinisphaera dokdonensis CL-ES53 TaxID=1304272 RepID=A0ABV2B2W8_9GAMM
MIDSDPANASIDALLAALASGDTCALDLVEATLARIRDLDQQGPSLCAMTYVAADQARAAALESDHRRAQGEPARLLEGIPVLLKDNIDVAGWPTRGGSRALDGLVAEHDAEIVKRLRRAGAVLIGKTAMHELACGITGASSLTGFARNPYHLGRSPGGSSSGAAVAVAAGYAPLAIGTDTAGSVQIPAAFNNLYGLRATRGTLPMTGIMPLSPRQDMAGPLTRYAADLERAFSVLSDMPLAATETATDISIGVLSEAFDRTAPDGADISAVVDNALERLRDQGTRIGEASIADILADAQTANVIAFEFDQALSRYLAERSTSPVKTLAAILASGLNHEQLTPVFEKRVAHPGTDDPKYLEALALQKRLRETIETYLDEHRLDLLVYPTVRQPPTTLGGDQNGSNGLLAPVTGLPSINLPAGFDREGLPVGMQLLARAGGEQRLLCIARMWERLHSQSPTPLAIAEH